MGLGTTNWSALFRHSITMKLYEQVSTGLQVPKKNFFERKSSKRFRLLKGTKNTTLDGKT